MSSEPLEVAIAVIAYNGHGKPCDCTGYDPDELWFLTRSHGFDSRPSASIMAIYEIFD